MKYTAYPHFNDRLLLLKPNFSDIYRDQIMVISKKKRLPMVKWHCHIFIISMFPIFPILPDSYEDFAKMSKHTQTHTCTTNQSDLTISRCYRESLQEGGSYSKLCSLWRMKMVFCQLKLKKSKLIHVQ